MYILAIDTSCDDTSAAVTKNDLVLSNVISSQEHLHKAWGGVVPSLARRAHAENIDQVVSRALVRAKVKLQQVDVFAVTYGPGLAIALEVGVKKAKELAIQCNKPLIAVNHMEGHIYANFARLSSNTYSFPPFPILALLVSGNHTELVWIPEHGSYEILGETLDDAAGEAFDKVARMLGLGYPGGALLAKVAAKGNAKAYPFTLPMLKTQTLDFSYSGIKSAVMRLVHQLTQEQSKPLSRNEVFNIAASFQHVAVQHLVVRTMMALQQKKARSVLLGGGVSANLLLRKELRKILKRLHLPLFFPKNTKLCADNAAMIAIAAYYKALRKEFVEDVEKLDRNPVARLNG